MDEKKVDNNAIFQQFELESARSRGMAKRTLRIYEGIFVLFLIIIFAFIFAKSYMEISKMPRVPEAKTLLDSIFAAEKSYYSKTDEWAGSFEAIIWSPPEKTRYVLFLGPEEYTGLSLDKLGLELPVDFEKFDAPEPGDFENGFVAVAIGNIDKDDMLDVWWVDERGSPENSQQDKNVKK